VGYRLGSFRRVRKIAKGFVLSVRPFGMSISAPTGGLFIKYDLLYIFFFLEILSRKFSFHSILTRITCTLHGDMYVMIISPLNSENGKWFRHKLQRKLKHILCSVTFF